MLGYLRLPQRLRKRSVYTLILGLSGVFFCLYFSRNAYPDGIATRLNAIIFGMTAFPAAYLSWPKTGSKSYITMTLVGIKTVALAFAILAILYPSWMIFSTSESINPDALSENIFLFLVVSLGVIIFGPVISMGVPFVIGILLALLFVDHFPASEQSAQSG